MGDWLKCDLPTSPRLCFLGDKTVVPQMSKSAFRVLIMGLTTCARMILRCWKEPQTPTLKMWEDEMMEVVACEKMLGRLNCKKNMGKAS